MVRRLFLGELTTLATPPRLCALGEQFLDQIPVFDISRAMESKDSIPRMIALAHDGRLRVYRKIVKAEQAGISAGDLSQKLRVQPNPLSARLKIRSASKLIVRTRHRRKTIYRADLSSLNELVLCFIEDCNDGRDEVCAPTLNAIQPVNA